MLKILTLLSICCLVTGQQKEHNENSNSFPVANKKPLLQNLQGQKVQNNYNDEVNYHNSLSNAIDSPYLTNAQGQQKQYNEVENNHNDFSNIKSKTLLKYLQDQQKEYNDPEYNYDSVYNVNQRRSNNVQVLEKDYNDVENYHNSLSNAKENRNLNRVAGQQKEYNYNSLSNDNAEPSSKTLQGQQNEYNDVENNFNHLSNVNKNLYLDRGQLSVQNLQGQKEYNEEENNYNSMSNANEELSSKTMQGLQKEYSDLENNYKSLSNVNKNRYLNRGPQLSFQNLEGQQQLYNDVENNYNSFSNVNKNRYLNRGPQLSVQKLQGQQKEYDDIENNHNSLSNANKKSLSKNLQGQQQKNNDMGQNYYSLSNANERRSFNSRPQLLFVQKAQGKDVIEQLVRKPCPRRRSQSGNIPTAEEWVPTYHWKYERPLAKTNTNLNTQRNTLQSQSLKSKEDGKVNDRIYEVNTKKFLNCLNKSKQETNDYEKNSNVAGNDEESQVLLYNNFEDGSGAKLIKGTRDNKSNDKTECLDKDESHFDDSLSSYGNILPSSDDSLSSESARLASKDRLLVSQNNLFTEDNSLSSSDDDWLSFKATNSKGSISDDSSLHEYSTLRKHNNSFSSSDDSLSSSDILSPSEAANSRRSSNRVTDNYDAVNAQNNNLQIKDTKVQKKYHYNDDLIHNELEANVNEAQNNEDQQDSVLRKSLGDIEGQLMEPTKGTGLSDSSVSRVMLMQNSRVCYACSSASDQTCWNPNRRTTVKYCRRDHDVCVTKTYKSQGPGFIVVRDCAESCEARFPTLETKYSSCSVCRNDLCNSGHVHSDSYSIKHNYNMVVVLFITCVVKYL